MPIIYIDESGFEEESPRTHGYAAIGKRCCDKGYNWQIRKRTNAIGALLGKFLVTVSLFVGSINADCFYAWTTQDLLPKLNEKSVIVMDNATFHKRKDIVQAIENKGHIIEWLPPYSPDLNPIEHKWSQAKSIKRKLQCSINDLFQLQEF